jgi:hypothetical protein
MDDVGVHAPYDCGDGLWLEPAGYETPGGCGASDGVARPLEYLRLVAVGSQQLSDVFDRALLAALQAVAVV